MEIVVNENGDAADDAGTDNDGTGEASEEKDDECRDDGGNGYRGDTPMFCDGEGDNRSRRQVHDIGTDQDRGDGAVKMGGDKERFFRHAPVILNCVRVLFKDPRGRSDDRDGSRLKHLKLPCATGRQ